PANATEIAPALIPAQAPATGPPGGLGSVPPQKPGPFVVPPAPVPPSGQVIGSPPILMPPPPPEPFPAPPAPLGHWPARLKSPPVGWFASVEIDVVGPHVKNRLIDDVSFANGLIDTIHLPMASLDWTASPRFEAGYRFVNNGGQVSVVYRFLTTEGRATL